MTIRSEHVERIRKCRSVPHDAGHDEYRPGLPRGRSRRRHAGTRFFRSRRAEASADLGEASEGVIHGRDGPDRSGQDRSRFSRFSQSCPTCSSSVHSGAPDRGWVCAHARASSWVSNDCWSMTAPSRSTIRKCFTPGIVPGEHSLRAAFGRIRRPERRGGVARRPPASLPPQSQRSVPPEASSNSTVAETTTATTTATIATMPRGASGSPKSGSSLFHFHGQRTATGNRMSGMSARRSPAGGYEQRRFLMQSSSSAGMM